MKRLLLALIGALLSMAAFAQAIPTTNTRPVVVNAPPAGEASLQSITDGLFGAGWGLVGSNQSSFGYWTTATASPTTIPTIVAEFAANAPINKFGIWFGTDASNIFTYDLLLGPATVGSNAAIYIDNGRLAVGSSFLPDCGTKVNCSPSWVVDSRITSAGFGFYFQTANNPKAFSIDALNPGSQPRFLSFQNGASTNWAFAFEDKTDFDYNDMVVKIESITPVPEPGVVATLALGLVALGFVARRRQRR